MISRMLFLLMTLFSCCDTGKSGCILIEGTIPEEAGNLLYLVRSKDTQGYMSYYTALDSTEVDSTGNFSFGYPVTSGEFYQIRNQKGFQVYSSDLYLKPGDSLRLDFQDDGVQASGNAGYRAQIQQELSDTYRAAGSVRQLIRMEPDSFALALNNRSAEMKKYLANLSDSLQLDSVYHKYLTGYINDTWINDHFYYLKYHGYYAHRAWGYLSEDSIPADLFPKVNARDKAGFFTSDYHSLIGNLFDYYYDQTSGNTPDSLRYKQEFAVRMAVLNERFTGTDRDIAYMQLANKFSLMLGGGTDSFYEMLGKARVKTQNDMSYPPYQSYVKQMHDKFMALAPGQPAPDVTLPSPDGTLISLSDFRGKLVYVDIWGTWCPPCIESIPDYKDLYAEFGSNPSVAFLNIALEYAEEDIERWRSFITDREYPGIHVVADKQFRNLEIVPYQISFAPTYMLIAPDGTIINPRAHSPGKIREEIISFLNRKAN